MAQVLVSNEGATLLVPIVTDQTEGRYAATCPLCGEIAESHFLEDVIQDAKVHVDRFHE